MDADDLDEFRKNRLFEIKITQILKEISIYSLFLFILYVIALSNLSSSSFQYNQLFLNTFVHKQKGEHIGLNDVKFKIYLDLSRNAYKSALKSSVGSGLNKKNYFNIFFIWFIKTLQNYLWGRWPRRTPMASNGPSMAPTAPTALDGS